MGSWVMSPRYPFDSKLEVLQNFPKYQGALRALCLSDDSWATRPAVELLCSGFTSIKPKIITVTPADTGAYRLLQPALTSDLTPAPGRQALSTSLYATAAFVFAAARPPLPEPNFLDDHDTSLLRARMTGFVEPIPPEREEENFRKTGLTPILG
jgi:hypothetical protein